MEERKRDRDTQGRDGSVLRWKLLHCILRTDRCVVQYKVGKNSWFWSGVKERCGFELLTGDVGGKVPRMRLDLRDNGRSAKVRARQNFAQGPDEASKRNLACGNKHRACVYTHACGVHRKGPCQPGTKE